MKLLDVTAARVSASPQTRHKSRFPANVQQGLRPSTRRSPLHQEHSHPSHDLGSAAGQERSDKIECLRSPLHQEPPRFNHDSRSKSGLERSDKIECHRSPLPQEPRYCNHESQLLKRFGAKRQDSEDKGWPSTRRSPLHQEPPRFNHDSRS
jgi:hypothetical protein